MSDHQIVISGFTHYADQVGFWSLALNGIRVEASTAGELVMIHPRPRQLTKAELAQLETVLRASKPFALTVDKAQITADGVDTAIVTVTTAPDLASIDLDVRGQTVALRLADGVGTLELTASAPTLPPHIVVKAVDQMVYGHKEVIVEAV